MPVGIRFSPEGALATLPATCVDCVLVLIGLFGFIGTIILIRRNLSPYSLYYSPAPVFHKSTLREVPNVFPCPFWFLFNITAFE